jgi:hypothetical protein
MRITLKVFIEVESDGDLDVNGFSDSRIMTDVKDPLELPILASAFAAILAGKTDERKTTK